MTKTVRKNEEPKSRIVIAGVKEAEQKKRTGEIYMGQMLCVARMCIMYFGLVRFGEKNTKRVKREREREPAKSAPHTFAMAPNPSSEG